MKSFSSLLGTRKQNKVARFAASIVATLAIALPTSLTNAGGIHSANATPVKTTTAKEITSVSVQLNQTTPNIAQLPISRTQYQAAGIDPVVLVPILLVSGFVYIRPPILWRTCSYW